MKYIINTNTNPYFNLALDEYAMKHIDEKEDFFFLWQNEPAVIIGKNQTTIEEVNMKVVTEQGIKVARRVSGGGAVYHDFGNLNFTFIINVDDPKKVNFKKYVQPMIDALNSLGIKAYASGRNDILIDGLKMSGNAQRFANGKLMHHGTIMFDVNIEDLVTALTVDESKIISKGVKSVRSRVTNIKEHLPEGTTLEMFWEQLHYYLSNKGQDSEIVLEPKQIEEIEYIASTRFASWDWIFGKSPEFELKNSKRFTGGKVECLLKVDEGTISEIRFLGDYLGVYDVVYVEEILKGIKYEEDKVKKVLDSISISDYFGTITVTELLEVIFNS